MSSILLVNHAGPLRRSSFASLHKMSISSTGKSSSQRLAQNYFSRLSSIAELKSLTMKRTRLLNAPGRTQRLFSRRECAPCKCVLRKRSQCDLWTLDHVIRIANVGATGTYKSTKTLAGARL